MGERDEVCNLTLGGDARRLLSRFYGDLGGSKISPTNVIRQAHDDDFMRELVGSAKGIVDSDFLRGLWRDRLFDRQTELLERHIEFSQRQQAELCQAILSASAPEKSNDIVNTSSRGLDIEFLKKFMDNKTAEIIESNKHFTNLIADKGICGQPNFVSVCAPVASVPCDAMLEPLQAELRVMQFQVDRLLRRTVVPEKENLDLVENVEISRDKRNIMTQRDPFYTEFHKELNEISLEIREISMALPKPSPATKRIFRSSPSEPVKRTFSKFLLNPLIPKPKLKRVEKFPENLKKSVINQNHSKSAKSHSHSRKSVPAVPPISKPQNQQPSQKMLSTQSVGSTKIIKQEDPVHLEDLPSNHSSQFLPTLVPSNRVTSHISLVSGTSPRGNSHSSSRLPSFLSEKNLPTLSPLPEPDFFIPIPHSIPQLIDCSSISSSLSSSVSRKFLETSLLVDSHATVPLPLITERRALSAHFLVSQQHKEFFILASEEPQMHLDEISMKSETLFCSHAPETEVVPENPAAAAICLLDNLESKISVCSIEKEDLEKNDDNELSFKRSAPVGSPINSVLSNDSIYRSYGELSVSSGQVASNF